MCSFLSYNCICQLYLNRAKKKKPLKIKASKCFPSHLITVCPVALAYTALHASPGRCPSLIPEAPGSWPDHGQASRAGFCVCAVPRHQGKGFIPASAPSLAPSFQWHSQGRFLPAVQNSETALRVDSSNQLSNVSLSAQHYLLITKHHLLAF